MKVWLNKKILILFCLIFSVIFCLPKNFVLAESDYPKLANYYLKYFDEKDYEELYRWDLIITPAEMAYHNPQFFKNYKLQNPNGKLILYAYPAMVNEYDLNEDCGLQGKLYSSIDNNNWWLKNSINEKIEIWPRVFAVNITYSDWQDLNVKYIKEQLDKNIFWDGVMYDFVDSSITHYSQRSGIDINNDGKLDNESLVNTEWQKGMAKLLSKTRQMIGNKIILINGNSNGLYQPNINGRMFESFPTPWEGNGHWDYVMNQYLNNLPSKNKNENVYIINSNTNNTGKSDDYKKMRFGLSSTLLGDGYFSFDYGDKSHAQNWWYDEYDVVLGKAELPAYNLLDKDNYTLKSGLWRRDYEYGIALVNSTDIEQTYIFPKEEMEKIKGQQAPAINSGEITSYVKLAPDDGILLLKKNFKVIDSSFDNGSYTRIFDSKGEKIRSSFFLYQDNFPGTVQLLISKLDNSDGYDYINNSNGQINIYINGKKSKSFYPYEKKYNNLVNFSVADINNDQNKEIITSGGIGGGSQIRFFNTQGKLLNGGFFAYDKNFRGGASVAVGDLNGDGTQETITAPGPGGGPQIKIFDTSGKMLGSFFAYDKNFRGGVSVAVGDLNGDGTQEIITAPGPGGGPQIKIFNSHGKLLGSFFAFNKNLKISIKVIANDINNDKKDEILITTINF